MSPEARARYEKKLKAVNRNRKILAGFIALVLIAGIGAALSMTVLFNISSIKVTKKGSYYSEQEIISASGLDIGKNMIRTDFDSAAARIETMLPYVLEADIQKNFSGAVTITVKDNKAAMIFAVKNGFALADADGKVLELLPKEPEKSDFIVLKTSKELTANPGEYIGFADENEKKLYEEICAALKKTGLYGDITSLDISEPLNIKIVYQNRLRIKVGDVSDIESKLTAAAKTIEQENENNPNTIAEINATLVKKIYVNPLDTLEEKPPVPEEPTKKPEEETTEKSDEDTDTEEPESEDEENSEENEEDVSEGDTEDEEEEEYEENSDEEDENTSEDGENMTEEE